MVRGQQQFRQHAAGRLARSRIPEEEAEKLRSEWHIKQDEKIFWLNELNENIETWKTVYWDEANEKPKIAWYIHKYTKFIFYICDILKRLIDFQSTKSKILFFT